MWFVAGLPPKTPQRQPAFSGLPYYDADDMEGGLRGSFHAPGTAQTPV